MKSELNEILVRAGGKFSASLDTVIVFRIIWRVIEINLYTVALFTLIEPPTPSLGTKVTIGTDIS